MIDQVVSWIDTSCDREFLSAVVVSGYRFLYRGIDDATTAAQVRSETPDLLLSSTYDNDPKALAFFQELERTMIRKDCPVRPSTGHLATSSRHEAARWGQTASIWPIQGADYAWFSDTQLFYPRRTNTEEDAYLICNGRNCGTDSLDDALLAENAEVLFSAHPFLAVPASLDRSLQEALQRAFLL